MEYIIQEYKNGNWYLFMLAGRTLKEAYKELDYLSEKHPEKRLRIESVQEEDCWWRDPFLMSD